MNTNPDYQYQRKRIYTLYQKYRRLRDILTYTEQHIYPDIPIFDTLLYKLSVYLRDENIVKAKAVALELDKEWLKWKYKL